MSFSIEGGLPLVGDRGHPYGCHTGDSGPKEGNSRNGKVVNPEMRWEAGVMVMVRRA